MIHLGLCCINTELRKKNIFNSRTTIRKNFSVERAQNLALQNVKDLIPMIEWNEKNGIKCFRLSSDMYPHFTDTETERYTIDFSQKYLEDAGKLAKQYNQRILMHPGQYNQVGAKSKEVFNKTVEDLSHHANILDKMGIDNNGIIIVHGGGIYNDKENTIRRWIDQFDELPRNVKNRLVIENDEKCYSIDDCLEISRECKIPVVYDCHHYSCYCINKGIKDNRDISELLFNVYETWGNRDMLCHISEQGKGRLGHHSDYIEKIPQYFFDFVDTLDIKMDLEVEAKMKEKAIKKLQDKYSVLKK